MKPWAVALVVSLGVLLVCAVCLVGYFVWEAYQGVGAVYYTPQGSLPQITVPTYAYPADNSFDALARASEDVRSRYAEFTVELKLPWDQASSDVKGLLRDCAKASDEARLALKGECLQPDMTEPNQSTAHLSAFRPLASLWRLEGRQHERDGRYVDAAASYVDCLRLANTAARNGTVLHLLVSNSIVRAPVAELARCVGAGKMDAGELAALAERLDTCIDERVPLHEALALEWAYEAQTLDDLRSGHNTPEDLDLDPQSPAMCAALADSGRREIQEKLGAAIEEARKPYWEWTYTTPQPQTIMAAVLMPEAERLAPKVATRDARLEGLRVLVALQRCTAETGRLPGALGELAPEYIDAVPLDPFDGQPLRYKADEYGYVVYSAGPDRDDDLGAERLDPDTDEGDIIIWPAGGTYRPRAQVQAGP